MGAGAPMLLHDVAYVDNEAPLPLVSEISCDSSASDMFHCSGALIMYREDSTLVNTYLDKVARDVNIMPRSIMLKGSRGRRRSELSCAFLCLFNFALFDNCGDNPQAPVANFLCLVSGYD